MKSPVAKFLEDEEIKAIVEAAGANKGDLLMIVADTPKVVAESLSALRNEIGNRWACATTMFWLLRGLSTFHWWSGKKTRVAGTPPTIRLRCRRTRPGFLESDPAGCALRLTTWFATARSLPAAAFGIHRRDIQNKVFKLMNYSEEEIQARFGHMLDAFDYGAPPHGRMPRESTGC